jgi:hypothetical protein
LAKTPIGIYIWDCYQHDDCKHVYKLFVPLIYLHNLINISVDNWRVGMRHPFWKLQ